MDTRAGTTKKRAFRLFTGPSFFGKRKNDVPLHLRWIGWFDSVGNPNLKPEESTTWDGGVAFSSNAIFASLTYFLPFLKIRSNTLRFREGSVHGTTLEKPPSARSKARSMSIWVPSMTGIYCCVHMSASPLMKGLSPAYLRGSPAGEDHVRGCRSLC